MSYIQLISLPRTQLGCNTYQLHRCCKSNYSMQCDVKLTKYTKNIIREPLIVSVFRIKQCTWQVLLYYTVEKR